VGGLRASGLLESLLAVDVAYHGAERYAAVRDGRVGRQRRVAVPLDRGLESTLRGDGPRRLVVLDGRQQAAGLVVIGTAFEGERALSHGGHELGRERPGTR